MILKKTIFLSNKEKTKTMGILTLENKSNGIFGNIKLYGNNIYEDVVLGIKYNENICKQNINLQDNTYSFKLQDKINLNDEISCVLVRITEQDVSPIVWGYENNNQKSSIINSLKNSISKIKSKTSECNVLNTNQHIKTENITKEFKYQQNTFVENIDKFNLEENKNNYDKNLIQEDNEYSQISLIEEVLPTTTLQNESEIAYAQQSIENLFDYNQEEIDKEIDKEINKIDFDIKENSTPKFYSMISSK